MTSPAFVEVKLLLFQFLKLDSTALFFFVSYTVCSASVPFFVPTLGVVAGLYGKQLLQPLSVPGRHTATLPTAGTSNQSGPQARRMGKQGMTQSGACVG